MKLFRKIGFNSSNSLIQKKIQMEAYANRVDVWEDNDFQYDMEKLVKMHLDVLKKTPVGFIG